MTKVVTYCWSRASLQRERLPVGSLTKHRHRNQVVEMCNNCISAILLLSDSALLCLWYKTETSSAEKGTNERTNTHDQTYDIRSFRLLMLLVWSETWSWGNHRNDLTGEWKNSRSVPACRAQRTWVLWRILRTGYYSRLTSCSSFASSPRPALDLSRNGKRNIVRVTYDLLSLSFYCVTLSN